MYPAAADAFLRGQTQVVGCVLYLAAWLEDDETGARTAVMGKPAKKVICGSPSTEPLNVAAAEQAAAVLQAAGINGITTDRIRSVVWDKLVGNAQWNPLSALTLQPLGYLCRGHMVELALSIGKEVVAVAEAVGGIEPGEVDLEARLEMTRQLPHGFKTSMLQDIEAGREPETGPLLTAVIEVAGEAQVEVPVLKALGAMVRARGDALAGVHGPLPGAGA